MRANRRRDTGPERRVRSLLHARGVRYRVDLPILLTGMRPIRPDIVFPGVRLAVFIDGCFWHGCAEHGQRPGVRNGYYWRPKIDSNVERGARQVVALELAGWTVLRFWEHEAAEDVAKVIEVSWRALRAATSRGRPASRPTR